MTTTGFTRTSHATGKATIAIRKTSTAAAVTMGSMTATATGSARAALIVLIITAGYALLAWNADAAMLMTSGIQRTTDALNARQIPSVRLITALDGATPAAAPRSAGAGHAIIIIVPAGAAHIQHHRTARSFPTWATMIIVL